MAGTPHGRHSIKALASTQVLTGNEIYVSCFKGLEALAVLGVVNRVAYYFGDGGTGTDFHDGASPTTGNAFSVWQVPPAGSRTWSWYFLIQYSEATPFGGLGSGAPARLNASTNGTAMNLGFQSAVAFTSGGVSANPWTEAGGSTNDDGTDAKADPVWAAPAGRTLQVYPKNNNTGESYAASKENCSAVVYKTSNVVTRVHLLMDDDNIGFAADYEDNGVYNTVSMCGAYVPLAGMASSQGPLIFVNDSSNGYFASGTTYGVSAGGVVSPLDDSVRTFRFELRANDRSSTYQPNNQFAVPEYLEVPFPIYVDDVNRGLVGFVDTNFARGTYGLPTNATLDGLSRVSIGPASSADNHTTFPWDGATADPGNPGTTRDGIDF